MAAPLKLTRRKGKTISVAGAGRPAAAATPEPRQDGLRRTGSRLVSRRTARVPLGPPDFAGVPEPGYGLARICAPPAHRASKRPPRQQPSAVGPADVGAVV